MGGAAIVCGRLMQEEKRGIMGHSKVDIRSIPQNQSALAGSQSSFSLIEQRYAKKHFR